MFELSTDVSLDQVRVTHVAKLDAKIKGINFNWVLFNYKLGY